MFFISSVREYLDLLHLYGTNVIMVVMSNGWSLQGLEACRQDY